MDVNSGAPARGAVCPIVMLAVADPRLSGGGEVRVDRDLHDGGLALSMAAHRIENAGGAWQEIPELSWRYQPAARGSYRIRASVAATSTSAADVSPWRTFRVKPAG